jgi:hypothetical protein
VKLYYYKADVIECAETGSRTRRSRHRTSAPSLDKLHKHETNGMCSILFPIPLSSGPRNQPLIWKHRDARARATAAVINLKSVRLALSRSSPMIYASSGIDTSTGFDSPVFRCITSETPILRQLNHLMGVHLCTCAPVSP